MERFIGWGEAAVEQLEKGENNDKSGYGAPDGDAEGGEKEGIARGGVGVVDVGEGAVMVKGKGLDKVDAVDPFLVDAPAADADVTLALAVVW